MKTKRWIMWILVSLFFAGLLSNVGIELAYAGSKPRAPDVTRGEVIRLTVNHGSEIYVNERELKDYEFVKNLTWVTMLISFAGAGFLKVFGSKPQDIPRTGVTP